MRKIEKIFMRFLKENNIYHIFFFNCQYFDKNFQLKNFINNQLQNPNKAYRLFGDAFIWSETKEGLDFWLKIGLAWRKLMVFLDEYEKK